MNNKPFFIATALGLLSAVINIAPFAVGTIGLALSPFTVLPIVISVLGFGTRAGLVSGLIASVALALILSPLSGIAFFILLVAPPLWIGHLAGLVRHDDGGEEWYPLDKILLHLTIASALVVAVTLMISAPGQTGMTEMLREVVSQIEATGDGVDPVALEKQVAALINLLPVLMPGSIMIVQIVNFYIGARIARAQGWMLRPRDNIPATTALPVAALGGLAIALVLNFLDGHIGVGGRIFAGAFGMAFALVGLSVMHFLTRNMVMRPMILSIAYFAILMTFIPLIAFAIMGIVETLLGIRARRSIAP